MLTQSWVNWNKINQGRISIEHLLSPSNSLIEKLLSGSKSNDNETEWLMELSSLTQWHSNLFVCHPFSFHLKNTIITPVWCRCWAEIECRWITQNPYVIGKLDFRHADVLKLIVCQYTNQLSLLFHSHQAFGWNTEATPMFTYNSGAFGANEGQNAVEELHTLPICSEYQFLKLAHKLNGMEHRRVNEIRPTRSLIHIPFITYTHRDELPM